MHPRGRRVPGLAFALALAALAGAALAGSRPVLLAEATLEGGRLVDGGPLLSHDAELLPLGPGEAAPILGLHHTGATMGLVPEIPGDAGPLAITARVTTLGPARLDVLVDGAVLLADVAVPAGPEQRLTLELPVRLAPGRRRIEVRPRALRSTITVTRLAVWAGLGEADATPRRRPPRLAPNPERIPIFDYFPAPLGQVWGYHAVIAGTRFALKVDAHMQFAGAPVARIRRLDMQEEYDLLGRTEAVRLYYRSDDFNGAFDFSDDPPPFSLNSWVKIGDRYDAIPKKATNPVTGGFFHWIIQYRRFQPLDVPAGHFPRALRVQVRNIDTKSGVEIARMNMFLGKGVGILRRDGRFVTDRFKHLLEVY